jgi:uncharacterized membrane protein YhaH (DUF805 family)
MSKESVETSEVQGTSAGAGEQKQEAGSKPPSIGFILATKLGFARTLDFAGRATRSEYWFWGFFSVLAGLAGAYADSIVGGIAGDWLTVGNLLYVACLVPFVSVSFRRLHDIGRSGLWLFAPTALTLLGSVLSGTGMEAVSTALGVTGFVLSLVVLRWLGKPGDQRSNHYGPTRNMTLAMELA